MVCLFPWRADHGFSGRQFATSLKQMTWVEWVDCLVSGDSALLRPVRQAPACLISHSH
jgi:hypothetical protein